MLYSGSKNIGEMRMGTQGVGAANGFTILAQRQKKLVSLEAQKTVVLQKLDQANQGVDEQQRLTDENKKAVKNETTGQTLTANILCRPTNENTKKIYEENKVNKIIKLKSLDEQWSFQKILLDYNILDFTSKFYYF